MARGIRPIHHEERLSLVDHLDELRTRLIISGIVLGVAFAFCLWQNHALLDIINAPLQNQTKQAGRQGRGDDRPGRALPAGGAEDRRRDTQRCAERPRAAPQRRRAQPRAPQLLPLAAALERSVANIPRDPQGDKLAVFGVGESFTTTITVALYFALNISLPVILYELYGFNVPALRPHERRATFPLLVAVPFLFAAGVLFGYFVVLPSAVRFFVNFNAGEFNTLVQASQYYKIAGTIMLAMGLVFQVPVVILGATRAGLVTPRQLRKSRRYALLACAVIAAFLPGDAITLLLEMVPLYLLYEASILMASFVAPADGAVGGDGEQREPRTPGLAAQSQASPPMRTQRDRPCSRSSTM